MGKHSRSRRKTRKNDRSNGAAARRERRSTTGQHSTPRNGPWSSPLTAVDVDGLPPTPQQLRRLPNPADAASDGTMSVPVISDDDTRGWSVFDAQGRMVELLVFHQAHRLVKAEHRILDGFECSRDLLGDPRFAGYDMWRRERCVAEAPDGELDYVSFQYLHHPEPACDGTRSVLVSAFGTAVAWLVLDADSNLVDGTDFPSCFQRGTPAEVRFHAFLVRRLMASDPFVDSDDLDFGPDCDCGCMSEHS